MKTPLKQNIKYLIKIVIAVLLLCCLLKMPYGYFQFVRIGAFVGFVILSYLEFKMSRIAQTIFFVGCAILFNPIYKIYFTRPIWNTIDEILAIILLLWACFEIVTHIKSLNQKIK